ncbi:MAG: heme-binding domain-containing protein [Pyrinomonadaceae bacterium]|nr:heme-binding domain-containing protein [Pyrinomonadaceae bacterium]
MAKTVLKIFALLVVLVIVGIQFWRPDFSNPPVTAGHRIGEVHVLPENVERVLKTSCADCHSNESRYPWYSNIAPLSWGIHDHIRVGRDELNFSEWKEYSKRKRLRKLEEICEEVESGNMPHYQYLWLHPEAEMDESKTKMLCQWTEELSEEIEGGSK